MYSFPRHPSPVAVLNTPLFATPGRRDWATRSGLTVDFTAYNELRHLAPVEVVMPSDRDDDPCSICPEAEGLGPLASQCRVVFRTRNARYLYADPADAFHARHLVDSVRMAGGTVLRIELPLIEAPTLAVTA